MKSIRLFTLFAALLAGGSAFAQEGTAAAEESMEASGWKRIDPTALQNNPVVQFRDDWMALAAGREGDMNAMTIAWGNIGVLWNRPVVTVYVSTSRYTFEFMERNAYFTVTGFPAECRKALSYIGSHSGRDGDKLTAAGLTPEFTPLGNPVFREADLAIECKLLYKQPLDKSLMPADVQKMYDRMGVHSMYIGEIVNVWVK